MVPTLRACATTATPATPAAAAKPVVAEVAKEAPTKVAPPAAPAAPPAPKAAAAPKAEKGPANDFSKFLGNRQWDVIQAGEHVRVYVDSNTFAWIVMDRAGSSANALGESFINSLKAGFDVVDKLVADKKARVAIVASAKDSYCVGADIEMLYPVMDPSLAKRASEEGQVFFNRIESTSAYPVVAAINGMALGGGCELALACHHRVIASDKASMGLPECMLGLLPGAGGCYRLPRLCGIQTALKWILTSAPQKPDRCKKAGAVNAVLPSPDRFPGEHRFLEGVRAWAGKLVDKPVRPTKPKAKSLQDRLLEGTSIGRKLIHQQSMKSLNSKTKGKYIGQYKALECVLYSATHGKDASLANEAEQFSKLLVTPESKNMTALYFLDDGMKKVEKKTGMAKEKIPQVKKVGVIGAGVMGSGIVHYFANKGYQVAVKDLDQEVVDKGIKMVEAEFNIAVKKKKMDEAGKAKKMALITGGTSDDLFRDCDIIVEAAVEVMSIKKKIVQALESAGILDGKRLFATNTSSLSLTELQSVSKFPAAIVGMHFFNPVAKMPLVEVIKGKETSQEAAATIFNLAVKTGKKPIIVGDAPGFLVNRILGVYMAEAGRMCINDRADPLKVDKAIVNFGMPMGPFRLLDEVGLDVATHVGPVLENGLKSKRFAVSGNIDNMVKEGYLGKKNKKGFYRYEGEKEAGMNTSVTNKFVCPNPDPSFPEADIIDRCVLLMVNEAAMILAEGVAETAEDVDIGMVWGTGFPPFRGGLLQYADSRGAKNIVDRLNELATKLKDDRFKPAALLEEHAKNNTRFFPNRPVAPYNERKGFPDVKCW